MVTLAEFAKLEKSPVNAGVIEEIITANDLMPLLQFKGFEGNAFLYNRESTLGAASTHAVGDTWSDTEPTYTQKTASLAIVGVQHPLDMFIKATRGSVNDQKAVLLKQMAKSLGRKLEQLIITGEPEATSTEFEGLDSLIRSETRMMAMDDGAVDGPGTAETELTIDRLDAMIDLVEGQVDSLVMNKTMRRKLTSLARASGSGVQLGQIDMFGRQVMTYNGIPVVINDFITNAEQYNDASTWTSSTATTIFALTHGEDKGGYTILHNGSVLTPEIQEIGIKETKNEELYRMVVYLQPIVFSSKMIAALGGIDSAA